MTEEIEVQEYKPNRYIWICVIYSKVNTEIYTPLYLLFSFCFLLLPSTYTVLVVAFSFASIILILIKTHTCTVVICQSNIL